MSEAARGPLLYVESSALLAAMLEFEASAIQTLTTATAAATSALTIAEAARAIVRARATGRLDADGERKARHNLQQFEKRCAVHPISAQVLARIGEPFPVEPVRTLDAIHLVTALMLVNTPRSLTLFTRDRRIQANAVALGFQIA